MCQLTFIKTTRPTVARLLLLHLLVQNALDNNKDGVGIYQKTIFKTIMDASCISNLGTVIKEQIDNSNDPIIAHVRFASLPKQIKEEFSHPFENSRYVFAHNGTLEYQDEEKQKEFKKESKIDSQAFLEELTKATGKNIVEKLNNAMKLFYGKFAFLIKDKADGSYYAVRGESATLYYSDILTGKDEKIGYVINTSKETLDWAVIRLVNSLQVFAESTIKLDAVKLMESNSVFKLVNTGFEKIGEIKENKKTYTKAQDYNRTGDTAAWWKSELGDLEDDATDAKMRGDSNTMEITGFLAETGLTIIDLDEMLFAIYKDGGILAATNARLNYFVKTVMPVLKRRYSDGVRKQWSAVVEEMKTNKKENAGIQSIEELTKVFPNIQVPYFLTVQSLKHLSKQVAKSRKEKLN